MGRGGGDMENVGKKKRGANGKGKVMEFEK
jgi:hypothetical protein